MKQNLIGISTEEEIAAMIKRDRQKKGILKEIYKHQIISATEISRLVNLSIPTILTMLDELKQDHYILGAGPGESSGGRRPNRYMLNPDVCYVLCIDISRYYIEISLFDLANQPVTQPKILDNGLETIEDILKFIKVEVDNYLMLTKVDKDKVIAAGVSLPGLINSKTGISYSYLNYDEPATLLLEDVLNMPVIVENDMQALARGELAFGLASKKNNVLCLTIGSGIGMGIIIDGTLIKGASGYAGEFGHIKVVENGKDCHCGKNGCLETIASINAFIQDIKKDISNGLGDKLMESVNYDIDRVNLDAVVKMAKQGDTFVLKKLDELGEKLGQSITTLIHILNPELVIIGGELSTAGDFIIEPIQNSVNKHAITKIRRDAQIVVSELGYKASIMGALAMVMEKIFEIK